MGSDPSKDNQSQPLLFAVGLLLVFVLSNLVSIFNAQYPEIASSYFAVTAYLCTVFFYVATASSYDVERSLSAFLFGSSLGALVSIAAVTLGFLGVAPHIAEIAVVPLRAQGYFKDPNVFGPALVPVLLYGLASISPGRTYVVKTYFVFLCVACAVGVLVSFSRAAWLNALVAIAAYHLLTFNWRTSRSALTPTVAVAIGCLGVAIMLLTGFDELSSLLEARVSLQDYDADRFATQRAAAELFFEAPLGIGPGHSEITFAYAVHTLYLRLLVETGILGFLSMLILFAHALWLSARLATLTEGPD